MDYNSAMLRFVVQKVALSSPAAYLPQSLLAAIDKMVTARCDALDGATDGLVQDPAHCPMRAEDLICHAGETTDCLTPEQARVLHAYTTPLRDRHGHVLYPGWAMTNLSGPRGISYWTTGDTRARSRAARIALGQRPRCAAARLGVRAPGADVLAGPWAGCQDGGARRRSAYQHRRRSDWWRWSIARSGPGETKDPAKLLPFIQQGAQDDHLSRHQ